MMEERETEFYNAVFRFDKVMLDCVMHVSLLVSELRRR